MGFGSTPTPPAGPRPLDVLTVCPTHADGFSGEVPADGAAYRRLIDEHCAEAERIGAAGMLVYDFWQSLDPWSAAHAVLSRSRTLQPVVAVQSALAHPAQTARHIASLGYLYGRPVHLNVVAGAKAGELAALGASGSPEDRHPRSASFIACVTAVLAGTPHTSPYFDIAVSAPALPGSVAGPRFFVPGSNSAGFEQVAQLADECLVMAKPVDQLAAERARLTGKGLSGGIAMVVGIVAREDLEQARAAAEQHYAGGRRDALIRAAFAREATSTQHWANVALAQESPWHDDCLWYGGARVGSDAPKLVGSYEQVARALARYRRAGVTSLIADLPHAAQEYRHIGMALDVHARLEERAHAD
jgi:alkanesulfonate monooxygenase